MKKIVFFCIVALSIKNAFGISKNECGKYELFGKVVGKSGLLLKINMGTKSEYSFKINPDSYPAIGTYLNQYVRANWEITFIDNFSGEIEKPENIKIEIENSLNPKQENFKLLEKKECLKK